MELIFAEESLIISHNQRETMLLPEVNDSGKFKFSNFKKKKKGLSF